MEEQRKRNRAGFGQTEFVPWQSLTVGQVYFSLGFLDSEMLVPELLPLVFVGVDVAHEDDGLVYFQDYESYYAGTRFATTSARAPARFMTFEKEEVCVVEFEQVLTEFLGCSVRRKNRGITS